MQLNPQELLAPSLELVLHLILDRPGDHWHLDQALFPFSSLHLLPSSLETIGESCIFQYCSEGELLVSHKAPPQVFQPFFADLQDLQAQRMIQIPGLNIM